MFDAKHLVRICITLPNWPWIRCVPSVLQLSTDRLASKCFWSRPPSRGVLSLQDKSLIRLNNDYVHFHVPGNHVFLFMWHRDIRELINRCFLAISGCECVYECTDRSVSLRCSWFQGGLQEVLRRRPGCRGSVGVADLAGRQPLAYPLTSSLSYILHPPSRVPFGLESITRHCEVTSGKWRQRAPGKHRLDMLFFSTVT